MEISHNVRITGPLASYVNRLWENLLDHGYTPKSSRNILRAIANLSCWGSRHGISFQHLHPQDLARFFAARRRAGYTAFICDQSLDAALMPLESMGAIQWIEPKVTRLNAFERLFADYAKYILIERGVGQKTALGYVKIGRRFLAKFHDVSRFNLTCLNADDVISFILKESRKYSIGTTKYAVTALRAFFHFLFRRGDTPHDLSIAVPAVAGWRMSSLPKSFEHVQVKKLLQACDRRFWRGRRDFAVLLLMTRLGLRACEVARLSLDDIDWRCGELVIRGKNRRHDRLPLPPDIGAALACHLSDRTQGIKERSIFLRERAPRRGYCTGGIQRIVDACLKRTGLPPGNSHRLRHTAATLILRRGGSLDDVAHVLRHKSHDTTAIYAKVDLTALRSVVRRWLGGEK